MAKKNPCRDVVSKALGREATESEMEKIQVAVTKKAVMLWRTERDVMRGMSKSDQQLYAARKAAEELVADKAWKERKLAMNIAALARESAYVSARGDSFEAVKNIFSFGSTMKDGGPGATSIESEANSIAAIAKSELVDLVESSGGRFFGFVENGDEVKQFLRALWGDTSNPKMAAVAKAWREVTDGLRERANRAGQRIGDLGDLWHIPQSHDAWRMAQAGVDRWVEAVKDKLDRAQYIRDDGVAMDDAEIDDFLRYSFDSITTDGANKRVATGRKPGSGSRANRGSESRAIFFKDADSYMEYQLEFGAQSIYDTMFGHLNSIAKDIALMERLGPDAEANARLLIESVYLKQVGADRSGAASGKLAAQRYLTNAIFEEVAGIGQGPASAGWAGRMATLRSWLVASRLGSAVLSSVTDHATMVQTAAIWNIPAMKMYRNYLKAMNPANPDELRFLRRQGLALNAFTGSMDRFSSEYGGIKSAKIASAVMRVSGLAAFSDANRRAFSASMMDAMGHLVKNVPWDKLEGSDLRIMKAKGVTEETYKIWSLAKLETSPDFEGGLLSGRAVMGIDSVPIADREKAASKLMAIILEEQNMAVIEAGARDRAMLYAGTKRGTIGGELMKTVMQFKTFPFAMLSRHWTRGLSMPGAGKAQYMGQLMFMATVTGMLALELKAVKDGKDPREMWNPENPTRMAQTWWAAFMQGGGLGIFGDFLTSTTSRGGSDFMSTMSGPAPGLIGDVVNMVTSNAMKAGEGQETDIGADATRIVKGMTPGASLWFLSSALNNSLFYQIQEALSPGYLDRMRRRTAKQTGQEYFWEPGEFLPERAPDMGAAVGE